MQCKKYRPDLFASILLSARRIDRCSARSSTRRQRSSALHLVFQIRRVSAQKTKGHPFGCPFVLEVPARFELANNGFADRGLTTWLRYHMKQGTQDAFLIFFGAGDEARTRYLHLGKVALYRMSYTRIWCLRSESNQRHADFQSAALPTELQRHMRK